MWLTVIVGKMRALPVRRWGVSQPGPGLTPGHGRRADRPQLGVTKRCRLSWLTNSALVYEPNCGGRGSCRVSANEYSCAHGAQIDFEALTPYLTYGPQADM